MANVTASSHRTSNELDSDATVARQSTTSTKPEKGDGSVRQMQGGSVASQHQNNRPVYENQSDFPQPLVKSTRSGDSSSGPSVTTRFTGRRIDMYVPELDSQMMGKVHSVSQHVQCQPTLSYRTADSATGNVNETHEVAESLVEDKPPPPCPRVRDNSQAAPAVPLRRKDADRASTGCSRNTLSNHCLGLLPGGLSQQPASQFVINGDHHDYINQDHLDSILEEQETAFEQERAGINNGEKKHVENVNNYSLDESLANAIARKASVRSTVSTTSSLNNIEPLKSSSGHKSEGPQCRAAAPDLKNMGEFERRLFLAKQKGRDPMPSVMDIPWFHPGITRHMAECLLLHHEIRDGTYLMRQSGESLALTVRCQSSTRHYRVVWNGKQFTFGLGKFPTVEALQAHFNNKPIISGDSGIVVQLCNPYPRAVSEPAVYEDANVVTTGLTDEEVEQLQERLNPKVSHSSGGKKNIIPTCCSTVGVGEGGMTGTATSQNSSVWIPPAQQQPDLSINSMEGYLTKLGFHRKNWKRRWFVLYRNELKYFNNKEDKEPIKTINLEDAVSVTRDDTSGKSHCFRLVTSYRTFFMYAVSDTQANEWVQILQWKLSSLKKKSSPQQQ